MSGLPIRHKPSVPRVAVIPERYGNVFSPCASIRLHSFFDRMRRAGEANVRFLIPSEVEAWRPDVIVWQRVSLADVDKVGRMCEIAARLGARTIYDLDDNLLDMDEHRERDAYVDMVAAVRESVRCADEVWCSTPNLARRVAREGRGRITVMPNALDPELWELDRSRASSTGSNALRLLYMGTRTHDDDYAFLSKVMDTLHRASPGAFELHLVGVRTDDSVSPPWLRVHSPPWFVGASYPAFVHWLIGQEGFDLGVAPLMSGEFNDCKSPIKVLDYAAIGLATVASAVPAYTHSLRSDVNCFHAPNQVDAWVASLAALVARPVLVEAVRRNSADLCGSAVFDAAVKARATRVCQLAG
ncbi:glycosyltransferase family 4 protein [Cognatilysobacter lacus]|uniref:Glycosyltransferase family 4 protein n=1 Tax=Cognatilysobacter lacus TaxID=1643323 RepID=A0A5D8ZAS2_9GAMM|nr:glycosyltransferase family 4 protein [Lysobacter lacus]TZF91222.1 glycosyltransferase family 4 protein [Lysobacter lacus]